MSMWTEQELRKIDQATEVRVSSRRPDGTLRPFVPIWHTTPNGVLFIRSAAGQENGWFRRARRAGIGRVDVGGVVKEVTFERADPAVREQLDTVLHPKYDRFGPGPISAITGPDVLETTLRVLPGP